MAIRFCRSCGASLPSDARFCGECGRPAPRKISDADHASERRETNRQVAAIAIVFIGTLLAIVAAWLMSADAASDATGPLILLLGQAFVGLAACTKLGPTALRDSLGDRPTARWLALAVPIGLISYGISHGYVTGVMALFETADDAEGLELTTWTVLAIVAFAPLAEEWLDRGVLWRAIQPIAGTTTALWATSALFALSHGLNGGFFLEFPHRFVAGLLFGWLRLRSGSIVPGIAAHLTLNALAVLLSDG